MLLEALARTGLQPFQIPVRPRDADNRNIQVVARNQRLQCRKDLFARKIASCAEENERVGWRVTDHHFSIYTDLRSWIFGFFAARISSPGRLPISSRLKHERLCPLVGVLSLPSAKGKHPTQCWALPIGTCRGLRHSCFR